MLEVYGFGRVNVGARCEAGPTCALEQLDGWLADHQVVATDDVTAQHVGHEDVRARCTSRPAWKKTQDAYYER